MASSSTAKIVLRSVIAILVITVVFYVARPLYWKISATVHEIRHNKQTVKQGISQIVMDAQKSVGWYHDESDPGVREIGAKAATARRVLLRKEVYVVGGHIRSDGNEKGNVFAIDSNHYAEYNMFLDPHAAKTVFESTLNITLAPLNVQRTIASFPTMLARLRLAGNTPEAAFFKRLISRLHRLKKKHHRYHHTDMFIGEILGAVVSAGEGMDPKYQIRPVRVVAKGDESEDGEIVIDEKGKSVKILTDVDVKAFYELYAQRISDKKQSAVIGSFDDQQRSWGRCSESRSYKRRLQKRF